MGGHLAVSRIVGSILTVLTIMEKHFNEDMIHFYFQDSCFRMCGECLVLHLDSHSCSPAPKKYTDEMKYVPASRLCSFGSSMNTGSSWRGLPSSSKQDKDQDQGTH